MQIRQTQPSFGQSYRVYTREQGRADLMESELFDEYHVTRKQDSKNMLLTPKYQYDEYEKVARDVANAAIPPVFVKDEDGRTKDQSILRSWANQKLHDDIMEQIMRTEDKHAINLNVKV